MSVEVHAPARWVSHVRVVRRAAAHALKQVFPAGTSVAVKLVGNAEMLRLQRQFRGMDSVTDVLSFDGGDPTYAGDVALCVPVAVRQARELGHPVAVELSVLTVHALLHLWGLDHERSRADARFQAEAEMGVLSALGVPVEAALTRRGLV